MRPSDRPLPPVRRLLAADAPAFQALRLEGFARHPRQFRYAVADEADLPPARVVERLAREFVVGGHQGGDLVAIGGLTGLDGVKLSHKALLWGMYVRSESRGTGLGDAIVQTLLGQARESGHRQVLLTVAADNAAALRLYRRWGFESYGLEPEAVRVGEEFFDETLMVCRLG